MNPFEPFPVIPGLLQFLSKLLSITYPLLGLRTAPLKGYYSGQPKEEFMALAIISLILVPLSLFPFRLSLKRAKKVGHSSSTSDVQIPRTLEPKKSPWPFPALGGY